ncbi:MAG: hypothetical protein WC389_22640 [Lutibacter sp.]|jgi:hypothetical protein
MFENMTKEYEELKDMIKRIELAVCGDEKTGVEGLVRRVSRHDEKIRIGERIAWAFGGMIALISASLTIIAALK